MSVNKNKPCNHGNTTSRRRQVTGTQPARILLIDSNVLAEEWLCKSVVDALEKIFLLGANLSGACPIPLFGIYVLTKYPELILPLSQTKSNFVRLHSALNDLIALSSDFGKLEQCKQTELCVNEGIAEACRQYKRYTANLPSTTGNFHQLEVIFLTTRQAYGLQKQFVSLPEQVDLNVLKRIVLANISSVFNDNDTPLDSQDAAFELMSDDFTSLVDMIMLEAEPISLQKFVYSWLSEASSDTEQLQLILPPPSPVESQLVLKCDLEEKIINPLQLPIHDTFSVDMKSNICKHVFPPHSKALGLHVPIFQLKVLCSIPRDSLCESVLFGQPMVVHPTDCWRIDWDCLEKNQQMFYALCAEMVNKDQVLLSCKQHPAQNRPADLRDIGCMGQGLSTTNVFDSIKSSGCKPSGYFVLMPSENSILIKSIVCGELYLPSHQSIPTRSVSEENQLCIQSSLSKVEELSCFNPLDFHCGLFDALKYTSLPKSYFTKAKNQQQRIQGNKKMTATAPGGHLRASSWSGNTSDINGKGEQGMTHGRKRTSKK